MNMILDDKTFSLHPFEKDAILIRPPQYDSTGNKITNETLHIRAHIDFVDLLYSKPFPITVTLENHSGGVTVWLDDCKLLSIVEFNEQTEYLIVELTTGKIRVKKTFLQN